MHTTPHTQGAGKVLLLLATLVASAALSACNTVEGVGKDVKSAGEGIQDTAQDAKK